MLALPCWPTRHAPRLESGSREQKPQGQVRLETCVPPGNHTSGLVSLAVLPGRFLLPLPTTPSTPTPRLACDSVGALPSRLEITRGRPRATVILTRRETPATAWRCACGPLSWPVQISCPFRVQAQNPNLGPPPQGNTGFAPGKFHPNYSF